MDSVQQRVEVLLLDDLDFDEVIILDDLISGFVLFAHRGLPMFAEEFDSLRIGAALEVHVFAFVQPIIGPAQIHLPVGIVVGVQGGIEDGPAVTLGVGV